MWCVSSKRQRVGGKTKHSGKDMKRPSYLKLSNILPGKSSHKSAHTPLITGAPFPTELFQSDQ